MKRAVIFIDGQNLRYSLSFVKKKELDVDWEILFNSIVPEGYELIRAYWYNAATISQQEWRQADIKKFCPDGMDFDRFEQESREWYDGEVLRLRRLHDDVYSTIMQRHSKVEFRYVGTLKVYPYEKKWAGEKGVDVGLAVDLVTRCDTADLVILVSADADFAPAIQYVKDKLKIVKIVSIVGEGSQDLYNSFFNKMRALADLVHQIKPKEFEKYLIKNQENPVTPSDRS